MTNLGGYNPDDACTRNFMENHMRKLLKEFLDPAFSYWDFFVIALTVDVLIENMGLLWSLPIMFAAMIGGYFVRDHLQ